MKRNANISSVIKKSDFEMKIPSDLEINPEGEKQGISTQTLSLIISGAGLLASVVITLSAFYIVWSKKNKSSRKTLNKSEIKRFLNGVTITSSYACTYFDLCLRNRVLGHGIL